MSPENAFQVALQNYYTPPSIVAPKLTKKSRATHENHEAGKHGKRKLQEATSPTISRARNDLLMFDGERWGSVDLSDISARHPSEVIFRNTMRKVMSLNPEEMVEEHLLLWIKDFNRVKTTSELKKNHIINPTKLSRKNDDTNEAIEMDDGSDVGKSRCAVRFSSMNNDYAWLSNFFPTLILDPENRTIYPSVEAGYVAFKARKAERTAEEVASFAHIIDPKQAKQQGSDLWVRSSPEDNKDAVAEMHRLVVLKFQQNPLIAEWLQQTPPPFEEYTNDDFWGSAMGTATNNDSNQLGKIIERARMLLAPEGSGDSCKIALEFD